MKPLTPREYQALVAYIEEGGMKAAAASLGMSFHTMRAHIVMARIKTGARNSVDLAYRLGAGELDGLLPEEGPA